ncbi:unnamed protein product, partial [Schistosoma margrebowiei]
YRVCLRNNSIWWSLSVIFVVNLLSTKTHNVTQSLFLWSGFKYQISRNLCNSTWMLPICAWISWVFRVGYQKYFLSNLGKLLYTLILKTKYTSLLSVVVLAEIAGGVAAAVLRKDVKTQFQSMIKSSFILQFHCCGSESSKDYTLTKQTIPDSCKNPETKVTYSDCLHNLEISIKYFLKCLLIVNFEVFGQRDYLGLTVSQSCRHDLLSAFFGNTNRIWDLLTFAVRFQTQEVP